MSVNELIQLEDFENIFKTNNKVAVVTGASRGLGLQTAAGLLHSGCQKIYLIARGSRDVEAAAAALNSLQVPGRSPEARVYGLTGDISSVSECERLAAVVAQTTHHVDIFVANAGATFIGKFDDYQEEDFSTVMKINVNSVFFSIQKFTPLLSARGTIRDPSRVIMVSSVAGVVVGDIGPHGTYAYAASKAAVLHLMHNLALELGPRHITVNAVAPGIVPSKMSGPLMARHGGLEEVAKQVPDQKLGTKEDIAGAMVFLSSRAGAHINGATLVLDGGSWLVRGCA